MSTHFKQDDIESHKSGPPCACGENNDKISGTLRRSFESVLDESSNVYKLFYSFTKKLSKFFSITRAVLVVQSRRDACLKVVAVRAKKSVREGLTLTLPRKDSLLYRVFEEGIIYVENYPGGFDGNFIEKKLLLEKDVNSLVVVPITFGQTGRGLLCFTSPILYAFGMFEEGHLEGVIEEFGLALEGRLQTLNI